MFRDGVPIAVYVGKDVRLLRAARKGSVDRYVPARWALVGLVIRNIPSVIFRRLDI